MYNSTTFCTLQYCHLVGIPLSNIPPPSVPLCDGNLSIYGRSFRCPVPIRGLGLSPDVIEVACSDNIVCHVGGIDIVSICSHWIRAAGCSCLILQSWSSAHPCHTLVHWLILQSWSSVPPVIPWSAGYMPGILYWLCCM